MKAIVRNYPGTLEDWTYYDSVSHTSYSDIDEAKKHEELSPLHQVIATIEDSEADKYKKDLWENRTFREFR